MKKFLAILKMVLKIFNFEIKLILILYSNSLFLNPQKKIQNLTQFQTYHQYYYQLLIQTISSRDDVDHRSVNDGVNFKL